MSGSHANISIFVPHMGCPHRCSFCNQNVISGAEGMPTEQEVRQAVITAMQSRKYSPENTEIAFFGGSFTAIDRMTMVSLLKAAEPFVKNNAVRGIRVSTRPDAINPKVLAVLASYGVTAIELGAQSMDDRVLARNHRGHNAQDVRTASRLIRESGFELGLQMMTGLYGDTVAGALQTARELIALQPDTVRIYPTVVLQHTELARLYEQKKYIPQTIDEAAELCQTLLELFRNSGIRVIRLGLHSIDRERFVAGPWHPAFAEIVMSKQYLAAAERELSGQLPGKYRIFVASGCVSKMIGQRRCNLAALSEKGFQCAVSEDPALSGYEIRISKDVTA